MFLKSLFFILLSSLVSYSQSYTEYLDLVGIEDRLGLIVSHKNTRSMVVVHVTRNQITYVLAKSSSAYEMKQKVATGKIVSPEICRDILNLIKEKDKIFFNLSKDDQELADSVLGGSSLSILTKNDAVVVNNSIYLYKLKRLNEIKFEADYESYVNLYLVMSRLFPQFLDELYDVEFKGLITEKTEAKDLFPQKR